VGEVNHSILNSKSSILNLLARARHLCQSDKSPPGVIAGGLSPSLSPSLLVHIMRSSLLLATCLLLTTLLACKSEDEFSGAPSIAAPAGAAAQAPAQAAPGQPSAMPDRAGPLGAGADTTQLPSDHPPIGAAGMGADTLPPAPAAPAGALSWTAPEGWQAAKPASSMRMAEYVVPGDAGAASMTVFYFGAGGGGGVEPNIARWVGQFKKDGGAAEAKRATRTVNGLTVHTVDVAGTYNAGAAMMGGAQDLGDQRVLGAIVETPQGPYFFKLLGPVATIAAQQDAFEAFVQSFKPGA
jgi:hypothetical protein